MQPTTPTVLFTVVRWESRPRHGGVYAYGTTVYESDDTGWHWYDTYARGFECPCGEPLINGDPVLPYKPGEPHTAIHVNCKEYANG